MERNCLNVLPRGIKEQVSELLRQDDEEIRISANRPVLIMGQSRRKLDITATAKDCEDLLELICGHSVFAHEEELKGGYITLEDGSRVGMAGKMTVAGMTMPHSFNIRIARQVNGAADDFLRHILQGGLHSALLISEPGAGKTTVLRDAARQLSGLGYKVGIADERGEISAPVKGVPELDVGYGDVICGCGKAVGMIMLIRGMSPEILITDEIATKEDAAAILDASVCGVKVIASAHGNGSSILKRPGISRPIREGAFEKILLLKAEHGLRSISDITGEVL